MHVKNGWFRNTKLNESDREVTGRRVFEIEIFEDIGWMCEEKHPWREGHKVITDLVQF